MHSVCTVSPRGSNMHASVLPSVLPVEHPVQLSLLPANYQRKHLMAGSEITRLSLFAPAALQLCAIPCCIAQSCCLKEPESTGSAAFGTYCCGYFLVPLSFHKQTMQDPFRFYCVKRYTHTMLLRRLCSPVQVPCCCCLVVC